MLARVVPLCFLVVALVVGRTQGEVKKADTHEGKIVKIDGNKLTMADKEGKNQLTWTLAPDAKFTCDGKECKLLDLKPGFNVRVTTKEGDKTIAVRVDASTK